MTTTATVRGTEFALPRFLVIVAIAAAANAALWFLGTALGAAMSVSMSGGQDIGWPQAIIATAFPLALVGTVVWLITRRWSRVLPIVRTIGAVLAVASAAIPLFVAVDPQSAVTLAAMHLAAGAAWFVGTRPRAATDSAV